MCAGLPEGSDFALYSGETDRTLGLRNILALSLGRRTDFWSPATLPVDVFMVTDGAPSLSFDACALRMHLVI